MFRDDHFVVATAREPLNLDSRRRAVTDTDPASRMTTRMNGSIFEATKRHGRSVDLVVSKLINDWTSKHDGLVVNGKEIG
jgi:hypothetical protein